MEETTKTNLTMVLEAWGEIIFLFIEFDTQKDTNFPPFTS